MVCNAEANNIHRHTGDGQPLDGNRLADDVRRWWVHTHHGDDGDQYVITDCMNHQVAVIDIGTCEETIQGWYTRCEGGYRGHRVVGDGLVSGSLHPAADFLSHSIPVWATVTHIFWLHDVLDSLNYDYQLTLCTDSDGMMERDGFGLVAGSAVLGLDVRLARP